MVSEILPRSPIVLKAKSSDSPRKVDLLQNLKSGCEESIFPSQRVISNKEASTPDCNSPPSGCKSSDGEWIWMAHEDWRLLEEFAGAAAGASDMLNAQRGALEVQFRHFECFSRLFISICITLFPLFVFFCVTHRYIIVDQIGRETCSLSQTWNPTFVISNFFLHCSRNRYWLSR